MTGEPQRPDRGRDGHPGDGFAEREAALLMLADQQEGRSRRITVGADKAFDAKDFVEAARALNVTPHLTKNDKGRRSNMDGRTTRHPGYAISLSCRWLVEKPFGWLKQTAGLGQVKLRGLHKVDFLFLRLRRAQPDAAAQAARATAGVRPRAELRPERGNRPKTGLQTA